MADSNTQNPRGKYKRRYDLGSNQEADAVLDVAVRSGEKLSEDIQRVGKYRVVSLATALTRPSDTTAYTAGDVVTDAAHGPLVFANAARFAGGSGTVLGVLVLDSAYVATGLLADLMLFDTTLTVDADNATFTPTDAELATCVGVISLQTAANWFPGDLTAGAGGNQIYSVKNVNLGYKCAVAATSLYGVLVARNAFVPVSAEIFTVTLFIEQE